MKSLNACKSCHFITEKDRCPHCSDQTMNRWRGYVIVRDPEHSQIAKKMNITKPGKYALKVS
jgi:DNA-directed RNA polymerase subunit E"